MRLSKELRRIRHDKNCTRCGTRYTARYALSKYCTPRCKQAAFRQREREFKAMYSELETEKLYGKD